MNDDFKTQSLQKLQRLINGVYAGSLDANVGLASGEREVIGRADMVLELHPTGPKLVGQHVVLRDFREAGDVRHGVEPRLVVEREPIEMLLSCPNCHKAHKDSGEWKARPHKTHRCVNDMFGEGCGCEWRPANVPTVGVTYLPREVGETRVSPTLEVAGVDLSETTLALVRKERELRVEAEKEKAEEERFGGPKLVEAQKAIQAAFDRWRAAKMEAEASGAATDLAHATWRHRDMIAAYGNAPVTARSAWQEARHLASQAVHKELFPGLSEPAASSESREPAAQQPEKTQ